jgi:L-threonylcarbamoyladenylate synthase
MPTNDLPILSVDDPKAPEMATHAVGGGGIVAFPTDTVYGIGVDLWQPEAIARLYALKGRATEKALPILMADADEWRRVAVSLPEGARQLMEAFWPGALTVVLPRRPEVPEAVGPLTNTIAVRVPSHPGLRRVLERTGPLATSSANRSGAPAAVDAAGVREQLGPGLALLLDGGHLATSAPSTVIDLTGVEPAIVRHGAIDAQAIALVLGDRVASSARSPDN